MERESESKSALLIAIFTAVAACVLRLTGLGSASLTMNEAETAMTALRLFGEGSSGQLLYELPTALLFKLFGSSEFTARLFPALMGTLLPLAAYSCRKKIGNHKALLLAFLLAADPVLLFWSKRADAVIPAAAFFAFAAAFLMNGRRTAGLTCFLIALSGGDRVWPILVPLVCFCLLFKFRYKIDLGIVTGLKFNKREYILSGGFFLLFCTAFGIFPGGLSGLGTGFVRSFQPGPSWAYPGLTAVLAAVILYCGIPLVFAVRGAFRRNRIPRLIFFLVSAVLLLVWKGIIMLPWLSFFLWLLALGEVTMLLESLHGPIGFAFSVSAFVIAGAYSFFYFRLVEVFSQVNGNEPIRLTWGGTEQTLPLTRFGGAVLLMLASILILGLIVKILMGFVNSVEIRRGMLCGALVVLCWGLLTGIWNAGGFDREGDHPLRFHPKNTAFLLNGSYTSYTNTALFELLDETYAKHGDASNTDFGVNFIANDPMVAWYLRDKPGIRTTANLSEDLTGVDLILDRTGSSYEGYGFVSTRQPWRGTMDWSRFSFQDWGKWLIFGDAQLTEEPPVSLWVRSDFVFTHGS